MKLAGFFVFSIIWACLTMTEAHACMCLGDDEARQGRINSAEFIGIFRVLDSRPSEFKSEGAPILAGNMKAKETEQGTAYRVEPLVTYKGSISHQSDIYVNHNNDCNISLLKSGKIYRGLVIKNKYGVLIMPSTCTNVTQKEWEDFEGVAKVSDEWAAFETACLRQGKSIRIGGEPSCAKRTGDKGAVCKDSSECEGFCGVPFNEYKYSGKDLLDEINGKTTKRPAIGKCSEWDNAADGKLVEQGYTQR